MAIVFENLKNRREPLSDDEITSMARRSAQLHAFFRPDDFEETTAKAFEARGAMGESEVAFVGGHGPVETVEAAKASFGACMDFLGDGCFGIKLSGYNGETLVAPLDDTQAALLAVLLLSSIDDANGKTAKALQGIDALFRLSASRAEKDKAIRALARAATLPPGEERSKILTENAKAITEAYKHVR